MITKSPTDVTRSHKLLITGLAAVGISLGATGASFAMSGSTSTPQPARTHTVAATDEVNGVNCENGIVVATGAQCDGGPAANAANDPNEPKSTESSRSASARVVHATAKAKLAVVVNKTVAAPKTKAVVVTPNDGETGTETGTDTDTVQSSDQAGPDTTTAGETDTTDCNNGIVAATGAQCDGGPAANAANDPNEPNSTTEKAKG